MKLRMAMTWPAETIDYYAAALPLAFISADLTVAVVFYHRLFVPYINGNTQPLLQKSKDLPFSAGMIGNASPMPLP